MRQKTIKGDECPDSTRKLIREGYLYIPDRIRRYQSSLFEARLIGRKTVCMSGKGAASLFYDQNLFTRKGAIPGRIQQSLFGKNAIQTMDGAAHMHRKLLFLSLMTPPEVERLKLLVEKQWILGSSKWKTKDQIILFEETSKLLFQAACKWAGVPLIASQARFRSKDMSDMIDAFGAIGPRHWKGRCARNRSEYWVRTIINDVRTGKIIVDKHSALSAIAWHKDLSNQLLCSQIAAVELINLLRPITAIATYITFEALALHNYPQYREVLKQGDEEFRSMFVQEVRRFYPFGPFLGARARKDFKWSNHSFQKGDLVFLDIFGTNHDKELWKHPNVFDPENFRDRTEDPFDFIPQGGGEYKTGTRCPGEKLTIELMKVSLDFLINRLEYEVPLQDLSYPLNRIPAIPRSRIIMTNVKLKKPLP